MENFIETLNANVDRQLDRIEKTEAVTLEKARMAIEVLDNAMQRLKEFTTAYTFPDEAGEIRFFKTQKPCLLSKFLYYSRIYEIEIGRTAAGREAEMEYLRLQAQRITNFFERNIEFFHYFRSGNTSLDRYYYLRGNRERKIDEGYFYDRDPKFTTLHDYTVAKIMSNDLIRAYLHEQFRIVEGGIVEPTAGIPKVRHTWTGKKIDFVTMLIALKAAMLINHGKATVSEMQRYGERMFNIDLGTNVYRYIYDLSIRRNPGELFDRLKECLLAEIEKMNAHDPARK